MLFNTKIQLALSWMYKDILEVVIKKPIIKKIVKIL